jgi:hypothetical protein
MKKLVLSLALIASAPAFAWGDREQGILAGVIGTMILQNTGVIQRPPVVVQQAPVIIQQQPVYNLPRAQHGVTPIYEKRTQWDANCNCYIVVYNQIGWQ